MTHILTKTALFRGKVSVHTTGSMCARGNKMSQKVNPKDKMS